MKRIAILSGLFLLGAFWGCGGDDDDEQTGAACAVPGDCYREAKGPLRGEVMCLRRVEGGYCTHLCQMDSDCCAVEGECKTRLPQVCSPFESTGQRMCFLSCEPATVGDKDPNVFCQENAHKSFVCRSTGGGAANRRVCVPGGA